MKANNGTVGLVTKNLMNFLVDINTNGNEKNKKVFYKVKNL